MKSAEENHASLTPLAFVWLGLVALSLLSLVLGEWIGEAAWLPVLVAAIIWLKAWLVARYFLEITQCTTFIRRLVLGFIAFAPIALVLTDTFGPQLASILQL